MLRPPAVE